MESDFLKKLQVVETYSATVARHYKTSAKYMFIEIYLCMFSDTCSPFILVVLVSEQRCGSIYVEVIDIQS